MNITVAEAHNRLSHWLKQVRKGPIVITRRGQAIGVIVDPDEYENLRKVKAYLQMMSLSHTLRDSDISAAELYRTSHDELEQRS